MAQRQRKKNCDYRSNNFGAVGCFGSNESDVSVSQTSQLTVMANLSKSRRNSTHETDKCVLSISCWCAFAERKNKNTGVPTVRQYTSHDVFKNPSFVHIPHSPKSESVCDDSFIDPNCVQFCQRIHASLHNHTYTLCLMCLCRCCSALVVMSRKPPQLLRSVCDFK